jgi:hypothetical protein
VEILNSIIPRNFIALCVRSFFSIMPLAAEPMGAGVSSGAVDLLAFVLPVLQSARMLRVLSGKN